MSDSELQDLLKSADDLVENLSDDLQGVDDFLGELQKEQATAPLPTMRWTKRDSDGNVIRTPGSSRRQSNKAGCSQKTHPSVDAPDTSAPGTSSDVVFAPDAIEGFLQDLQQSLCDATGDEMEAPTPRALLASTNWSTRKSIFSESWRAARPQLVNTAVALENVEAHICQQCSSNSAVVRCRDCRPRPFFCAECDVSMHTRHPLHNRDGSTLGFFQPLPPTTYVLNKALSPCVRYVPVEIPDKICGCSTDSLSLKPGKAVAVITMNGRHELSMPELACSACKATWTSGVEDVVRSDYWPATLHFATIYAIDVFFSYEEIKMAAPGLSCQAFLKMLDQRTVRFGRTGKISSDSFLKSFFEWEAVRYEVDSLCKEEPFTCQACSPDMLAVSVDGNRKHYRFKNAARSEEQAIFGNAFIAKDEDVTRFVNYIHSTTKHVSGRGVCGGEWSAARETSQKSASKLDEEGLELAVCRHGVLLCALNMYRGEIFAYPLFLQEKLASSRPTFFCMDVACKYWPYLEKIIKSCPEFEHLLEMKPFLSVFHAKAHDFKCEIKWSGAFLEGAGLTLGEEVEQVNAFLSRIAVTTKHMSKAGRTDMLTLMAMRWNEQKMDNLATYLSRRYLKTTKALEVKEKEMESMKAEMAATDGQFEDWVRDVKDWAETTTNNTTDAAALASKIEMLVVSIKRRSQRLYKDYDSNKGRARIRRKIREEKGILTAVVEQYNGMVPSTETLCLETILSGETAWPWQLPDNDSVDLRTKRRVFDSVMAGRRLREEKTILLSEMNRHWRSLTVRGDSLKELSSLITRTAMEDSPWALTEDGMKGLQSIAKQKLHRVRERMAFARQCYLQVLTGAENLLQTFSEDYSDSDSDSDLEDLE